MNKHRVLIIDDHPVYRVGLVSLLKKEPSIVLVGHAQSGGIGIELAQSENPDVILLDFHFPSNNAIDIAQKLTDLTPDAKILAMASHENEQELIELIRAGAKAIIQKGALLEDLLLAIRTLSKGSSFFSKEISLKLLNMLGKADPANAIAAKVKNKEITNRELEVLKYIAAEMTNKEIAIKLFISPRTVETHRRNLIHKLRVKNTAGLVRYYLNHFKRTGGKMAEVG